MQDKILSNNQYYEIYQDNIVNDIVQIPEMSSNFREFSYCPHCQHTQCVECEVTRRIGLATFYKMKCKLCGFESKEYCNAKLIEYQTDGKSSY
jgi:transcription elongation factor Elf1